MALAGKAILQRRLTRSVISLLAVGIALVGRSALDRFFGPGFPPYISLCPVVMAVAILAGFWQVLLATLAAGLVTACWILSPNGQLKLGTRGCRCLGHFPCNGSFAQPAGGSLWRNRQKAAAFDKQALRDSESRFRSLFYNSLDAMFLTVPDGTILAANPSACTLFGMSEAELCQAKRQGLTDPDDPRLIAGLEERARTGKARAELSCIRKDGARFTAEVSSVILDGLPTQSFVVMRDVTERKRAEETLRLSEEKFARAFAGNPAAIALTRFQDGVFLDVNDTWVAMSGYSRREALGNSATAMNIWPTAEAGEWFLRELRENGSVRAWEQDFLAKSGEGFTAQLSAQVLTVNGEQLVLATLIDITARKRAEKALRESEDRFRVFFENVAVGAVELDPAGRFLQVNRRLCQMTAYSREELIGMNAAALTHPEDRDKEREQLDLYLHGQSPVHDIEQRCIRRDGAVIWVHITATTIRDAGAMLRRRIIKT